MVSMVAFQAVDPGSIPGHRIHNIMILSLLSFFSFFFFFFFFFLDCRKKNSVVASNTAYLSSTRTIYHAMFFACLWRYRKPRVPEKKENLQMSESLCGLNDIRTRDFLLTRQAL